MKFSSEAKVGLIGIVTLAVLIWGINYLKGRNILNSTLLASCILRVIRADWKPLHPC